MKIPQFFNFIIIITNTGESEAVPADAKHFNVDHVSSVSSQSDSERLKNDSRSTSNVTNQLRRRFERQRIPNDRPSPGADNIAVNQPAYNVKIIIGQLAALIFIILVIIKRWYLPILPSPQGPIIEINTKRHLPLSSSSWKLVARCKVYNSSYSIKHCQWSRFIQLLLPLRIQFFLGEPKIVYLKRLPMILTLPLTICKSPAIEKTTYLKYYALIALEIVVGIQLAFW